MGDVVVVVGADGAVAASVLERLLDDDQVERVVAIGTPSVDGRLSGRPALTWIDPASARDALKQVIEGAAAVVHLGAPVAAGRPGVPVALDGTANHVDVGWAREVFEAASAASVSQLVVLSGAMVYGAWANNPVPLTEEAPLRPEPGVAYAVALGELERLAIEWREANPSASCAVLRPTVTVPAHGGTTRAGDRWFDRSPWVPLRWRSGDSGPPVQFLVEGDLASAIAHARRHRLDGPFNVAPEGWIPAETLPELAGPLPQVQLPVAVADALTAARLRRGGIPPAVADYLRQSWVVASDRLRASGWSPADTNEEAFVGAYEGGPFASMDARRRQMLSLGAVAVVASAFVLGVVGLVRRQRGRRA